MERPLYCCWDPKYVPVGSLPASPNTTGGRFGSIEATTVLDFSGINISSGENIKPAGNSMFEMEFDDGL